MAKLVVKGTKELVKALDKLEKAVSTKILRTELKAVATEIATDIKAVTPVGDTGMLKRAIKVKSAKSKKGRIAFTATVGNQNYVGDQFYGPMVDLGTKHSGPGGLGPGQPAQHFIEKTFDAKEEKLAEQLIENIWKAIEREAHAK